MQFANVLVLCAVERQYILTGILEPLKRRQFVVCNKRHRVPATVIVGNGYSLL
jgi:hypothetical protein